MARTAAIAASAPLAAALLLAACAGEDPNAFRNQGEDCASCHREGGKAPRTRFTVAGTVFRQAGGDPRESGAAEVALLLTAADGERLELRSNRGGNFHTRRALAFPVRVALRTLPEGALREGPPGACTHGSCNLCHSGERPSGGARGRLLRP